MQKRKNSSIPVCSVSCGRDDVERFVFKNNQVLCGGIGKTVKLWWLKNNSFGNMASFNGHNHRIFCVDISDDLVFSGSKDCTVKVSCLFETKFSCEQFHVFVNWAVNDCICFSFKFCRSGHYILANVLTQSQLVIQWGLSQYIQINGAIYA